MCKMYTLIYVVLNILSFQHVISDKSDVNLTPVEMIANHGYPSETHRVTTDDGYILTLFRIPHGIKNNSTATKPPVLLMHGFGVCSGEFVALGPEKGLAYILADAGYDVWLGNTRGTVHSRNHTSLNADTEPEKYFDYTWHEIAIYDLAQSVDYVLSVNGDDGLYYVGHSQGTTLFLVLASTMPEYNEKFKLASLMAPAAIIKHYPNLIIQTICKYVEDVWNFLQKYRIYEIPFLTNLRSVVTDKCLNYPEDNSDPICDFVYNFELTTVEKEMVPIILSNCPSGAGLKQYVHYGQLVRNGGFRQFDHGTEKNLAIYGTEKPPDYDLSKISSPVAFYYAPNDHIIAIEDENVLVAKIPNVAVNYLVEDENFGHIDFAINSNVVDLVYKKLLSVMDDY